MNLRHPFPIALCALVLWTWATPGVAWSRIVPSYDATIEKTWPRGPIVGSGGWWSTERSSAGGTARLRAEVGTRGATSVLVRGTVAGGQPSSGYLIRLEGVHLHLERIDGNHTVALIEPERVRLPSRGPVELLVTHVGPTIIGRLYRAKTDRHLASVIATDATYRQGITAVRIGGGSKRHRDALERFSTRQACENTPNPRGERGRALWATLEPRDMARLKRVKAMEMEHLEGTPPRKVYRFDTLDLEQASCQGVPVQRASLATPWKYLDRSYRAARTSGLPKRDGRWQLTESYKNPGMVATILQDWATRFPELTHLEIIGRSRQGRPIYAMAIGAEARPRSTRPTILLNGAHHGNEPLSVDFVLDAGAELLHAAAGSAEAQWLENRTIWIVPVVNPDGLHAFLEVTSRTGRKNGHDHDEDGARERLEGVDLNRNYAFQWGELGERGSRSRPTSVYYRGGSSASEPEVQAMMALADREGFIASISYHTGTVAVLAPYTIPGVTNPVANEAWSVAEELVRVLPRHAQDRRFVVKKNLYPVDGTDQDWHRFAHGTVALLVEGARSSPTRPRSRARVLESVAPAWRFLVERFTTGRLLDIQVTDDAGRPVRAEVVIQRMEPRNGERWTTRCPSGRTVRALPRGGSWTVEIRRSGSPPILREVKVGRGPTAVVIPIQDASDDELCTTHEEGPRPAH